MNRMIFSSWRISPLTAVVALALVWLFSWLGLKLAKYNYPDSLTSAKDVPGWMVDGHFGTFTDARTCSRCAVDSAAAVRSLIIQRTMAPPC